MPERLSYVLAATAMAVAVAGLFTSYASTPPLRRPSPNFTVGEGVPRAPTWAAEQLRHHDNRLRHAGNLRALAGDRPDPFTLPPVSDAQHDEALARRARNRAYDGAPPTIPHPVDQHALPNCMTCHAEGLRIVTAQTRLTAPAVCHVPMQSCTQCHVVQASPIPGAAIEGGPPVDTRFVGLESVARGDRAWPGAPPVIPHAVSMRGRCESCHGVYAMGLRTSHPWRQSCTQCHAGGN